MFPDDQSGVENGCYLGLADLRDRDKEACEQRKEQEICPGLTQNL